MFEQSKRGTTSFWYIHRTNEKVLDDLATRRDISISSLRNVSEKLKPIRDKTHFHIDPEGVLDPKAVWRDAALTGKELSNAVDDAWTLLVDLQRSLALPEVYIPDYYVPAHVKKIALAVDGRTFG